ncbi:flagellar hook-length control protein FliK [Micrococcaceae bacterium Sec7.4]
MKGMDLSAALTSPVQSRGPQQGARQRSEPGNPDAGSFDAVFNDVHSVLPGKTPDADAARDVPADDAVAAPSDAPVSDAAAFAGSAGSTQVAASIEGTQQNVLVAALGLPATGRNETSTPPAAAAAVAATPGPDPRLAAPGAPRTGVIPAAAAPQAATSAAAPAAGQALGMKSGNADTAFAIAAQQAGTQQAGTQQAGTQQSAAQQVGTQAPATGTAAPLGTPAKGLQGAAPTASPGNPPSQGIAAATAAAPSPVTPATPAPAVAAVGAAAGFAAVATAEGKASGPARTESKPAVAPADALAAAGMAAAATPPANQPTATAGAPAPQAAAQAPSQPGATLQPQLAKPLFTLAGAPHGQHIMTLKVSPEDLGPMTVRAHIDAAGVRIELFAPGDAGREAIRGILPELRKELADAGFGASLDVSEHNGPGSSARDGTGPDPNGQGAGQDSSAGPGPRHGTGDPRPGHRWEALADGDALRTARILNGPQTTLDILV